MPPTRHLVACVLLGAALWMPPTSSAQDLAELFRAITPSVVVVRAKSREVTAGNAGVLGGDRPATIQGEEIMVRGDLMLEVTGIRSRGVQDMAQIRDTLGTMKTGSPLAISVLWAGKVIELTGTLP